MAAPAQLAATRIGRASESASTSRPRPPGGTRSAVTPPSSTEVLGCTRRSIGRAPQAPRSRRSSGRSSMPARSANESRPTNCARAGSTPRPGPTAGSAGRSSRSRSCSCARSSPGRRRPPVHTRGRRARPRRGIVTPDRGAEPGEPVAEPARHDDAISLRCSRSPGIASRPGPKRSRRCSQRSPARRVSSATCGVAKTWIGPARSFRADIASQSSTPRASSGSSTPIV